MSLLDLLHEIKGSEVKVIIGGGFGIYLKVTHVTKDGRRTLWREWPEPRSTNDLDLFLRPELIIESNKGKALIAGLNCGSMISCQPCKSFFHNRSIIDPQIQKS